MEVRKGCKELRSRRVEGMKEGRPGREAKNGGQE